MWKRLVPNMNRVLVEKIVPPSKSSGGILLPEKSTKLNSGKVVAVGPGLKRESGETIAVAVKEGDTVLLPEYGGTQVKLADKSITCSGRKIFLVPFMIECFLNNPLRFCLLSGTENIVASLPVM